MYDFTSSFYISFRNNLITTALTNVAKIQNIANFDGFNQKARNLSQSVDF